MLDRDLKIIFHELFGWLGDWGCRNAVNCYHFFWGIWVWRSLIHLYQMPARHIKKSITQGESTSLKFRKMLMPHGREVGVCDCSSWNLRGGCGWHRTKARIIPSLFVSWLFVSGRSVSFLSYQSPIDSLLAPRTTFSVSVMGSPSTQFWLQMFSLLVKSQRLMQLCLVLRQREMEYDVRIHSWDRLEEPAKFRTLGHTNGLPRWR